MLSAIIVAAGSSRRMGFDKLMAPLAGAPVLQHTINAFLSSPDVAQVIIVCPQARLDQLDLLENGTPLHRVDGGTDRHNSVANGLAALSSHCQWVSVHDGARPLISRQQISATLVAAKQHSAAASARRVTETVMRANPDNFITTPVDRENLWLMETPQIFSKTLLLKAYRNLEQAGSLVTDEVSALERIGQPTYLVANPSPNIKITFPEDLALAETFLTASHT